MPPAVVAAVAAGSAIAGGVAGAIERSNASDEAKELMLQRLQELEAIGQPPETSIPLLLQEFKSQGIITPELEKEITLNVSKLSEIKEDPTYKQAQNQALQFLQQRSETGMGAEERAAYNMLRKEAAKEAEGKRQQIIQNMAQRGMGGSGVELAAQLAAAQSGDEMLSSGGDKIAAEAARNALNSIMQSGNLAGQIRGQDFDVASTRARAEDELNRFNVANQISRQTRNIESLNEAQMANLKEKQRIADANIAMSNEELRRQNQAKMNDWQAKLNLAQSKGNIYGDQANQRLKEGQAAAAGWQQIGQGVSQGVASLGTGIGSKDSSPITSGDSNFNAETIYDDRDKRLKMFKNSQNS